jgi:predicted negative regulator of RcsB-dependent stress response
MASPSVARSRQRSTIQSDDAMSLRAAEVTAWAQRNIRVIMLLAAIVLAVVGGYILYRVNRATRDAAAAEQFLTLRANPTVATAAGAGQVDAFIRAHAGTVEADEARLLLAEIRLSAGQAKQAVEALRPLATSNSALASQAAMMMGSAHAQAGDRPAAIQAYELAADKADAEYQRAEALGQAALMHEQSGNFRGAAGIYQRLLGEAERGSPQATVLEMRMAEALARAGTPR